MSTPPQGPSMICATDAVKTGPARIGRIAGNITLPRTVALPTAIAVCVGAVLGWVLTPIVPGGGIQQTLLSIIFGGTAGWFVMTFSPLRDESMLTWIGLQVNTLRRQRKVNGQPVIVAVGSAVVGRETLGAFRFERAAVRVPAGAYDERGVLINARNRNLPPAEAVASTGDAAAAVAVTAPQAAAVPEVTTGDERRPMTIAERRAATGTTPAPTPVAPVAEPGDAEASAPSAAPAAGPRPLTIAERRARAAVEQPASAGKRRRTR